MPTMPPTFQSRGQGSARERAGAYERDRGSAAERGYDSKWRKARTAFLAEYPLCIMCEAQGRVAAASVVDHIKPHRGDHALFWARSNWQPLCKPHHDRDKQRVDRAGRD